MSYLVVLSESQRDAIAALVTGANYVELAEHVRNAIPEEKAVEVMATAIQDRFDDRMLDAWPDFEPEARKALQALKEVNLIGGENQ